jgi:Transposase DDE domain
MLSAFHRNRWPLSERKQWPPSPESARITRVNKKLAHFKKEAEHLRTIEQRMDATGETQVSLTDPDARAMATTSKQPRIVGYNVQNVVETKHHLIVAHEVTNLGFDREALSMMAQAAKEVMASEKIEAIADKGYYKGEEIVAAELAGVAVVVSKPLTSNAAAAGRFDKADFTYLVDENAYLCPAGERLTYRFTNEEGGRTMHSYWTNACTTCVIKHKCTTGDQRRVKRWEHEAILERVQKRLEDDPARIPLRSKTVEHPFGTIKAWMGATHFKMRTMKHVATEMALHVLAYNMMRVIAILGVPHMLEAMRG